MHRQVIGRQVIGRQVIGATAAFLVWLAGALPAAAQSGECTLVPDDRNPSQQIMRCGDHLVVRAAPGTRYQAVDQQGKEIPRALRLDAGALMIEFHPSDVRKNFQIRTPHAIAAVRGTKWAVEVVPRRSSTLVLSGEVEVSRTEGRTGVVLKAGEGVDVLAAATKPLAVKRWKRERVRALLARFGE